tara:strand:+ start:43 stop:552 length:510 start_codon:yes stop_codon:yes gene_type:complete
MSDEKITYSVHNYDPVNKYIDEKSRIKNAKSVWAYTKSLTLFILALGLFLVLASYAYHLFKKDFNNKLVENGSEINKNIEGENVVYSQEVTRFDVSPVVGRFKIWTGYQWDTVNDLRFGKPHTSSWCYLSLVSDPATYYFDRTYSQEEQLKIMGISENKASKYKQYCTN